ncbi:hypothetical protein BVC71_07955 [Marivivens niveibacter]|uniref:Flagellar protein FlgJ N-terminal domain-containing protein n=1 Tax=Marivivens niveibacter TaxID=1930667 RepID=A0A251X0Q5_9RHOB|nr:hypothetical protein [Marivivens niveibacter]OUD09753.1 hypothetical protein BVC71_07955 [Marivivens niveibacter]
MIATQSPIRSAAEKIETAFLSQMLKHSGVGETGNSGDQFLTFMHEAQARAIVKSGGIGLTESLFHALAERADG